VSIFQLQGDHQAASCVFKVGLTIRKWCVAVREFDDPELLAGISDSSQRRILALNWEENSRFKSLVNVCRFDMLQWSPSTRPLLTPSQEPQLWRPFSARVQVTAATPVLHH
jgi:hypothetical protein